MKNKINKWLGMGVVLWAAMSLSSSRGQSIWDGGGSDNGWLTQQNWTGDTAPTSATTTDIQMAGTTRLSPVFSSDFTLRTLTFNSGAGAFNLSGNEISIQGAGSADASAVINQSASLQTINNNLKFIGAGAISASAGDMIVKNGINFYGTGAGVSGARFNANVGKTLTLSGTITGAVGSSQLAFNGNGTTSNGTIYVSGNNTYTGTTAIWHATVLLGSDALTTGGALGNSSTEVLMGTQNATAVFVPTLLTAGSYTVGRSIRVTTGANTTAVIGGATAHVSTYSGTIALGNDNSAVMPVTLTAATGGRVNFTGNVRRAGGTTGAGDHVIITGGGVVVLSGTNNTYTGTTSVSSGTLLVNGSLGSGGAAVMVTNGATLGGTGEIDRLVSIAEGGTLSAGDMNTSGVSQGGTLSLGAGLTLSDTSILKFDLADSASLLNDKLVITGDLTLDGKLDITALNGFGLGTYQLMSYTGSLTNNGLTINTVPGGFTYSLDTSNNIVSLIVVPEPHSFPLMATGLVIVIAMSRGRRRSLL